MKESCTFTKGHYEIGLPRKQGCPDLPNNYETALARLKSLGRRLNADPELWDKYRAKIHDMVLKGHVVKIPEDSKCNERRVWYIPHHCIMSKFRVVFDCAAQFRGTSLNDQILQGPDNTNNLVGVVTRFCKNAVAVVGDVRAMFMQVRVKPVDQPSLRFLLWTDDDPTKSPKKYQLTVHCFGLTSSPSVAGYALQRTAEDNRSQSSTEAVQVVYRNIYVDNVLVSVADSKRVVGLVKELDSLLGSAGFELAKLSSNRPEVLEALPADRLAPCLNEIRLYEDEIPGHRALGLVWHPQSDVLGVKVAELAHPCTRRGLLSLIMSIFDPLGIISPFLLPLKLLLQRLTKSGLGWDAKIPEAEKLTWEKFLRALPKLGSISIPRCFPGLTQSTKNQLPVFSDASNAGIGAVSYLRTFVDGICCASFIMGKSRVAPVKPLSTPRMELSAAVIAVRLARFVLRELDVSFDKTVFWSDSTTVLGYLHNTSKRRPVFETNRIKLIRELSTVDQWRWIETRRNPADLYSRGVSPLQVGKADQWLLGPSFLLDPENTWLCEPNDECSASQDEPKVASVLHVASGARRNRNRHTVRVTARLLRLRKGLHQRVTSSGADVDSDSDSDCISASEYDLALLALIRLAQRQEFPGLVEAL